jgi:cyclase
MRPSRRSPSVFARTLLAAAVAFAASAAPAALAQPNPDEVEIVAVSVAPEIWVLQGAGGNIGVSAGEDGAFLIDDGYAPLTAPVLAALETVTAEPVRFVINTHWHGDHTGGNERLGEAAAVIVAHDNVRQRLSTEQFNAAFQRRTPASPPAALPVVTFADGVTLHLNGDTVAVTHVPAGHTDGDAVIRFREDDVLHTGDLFFNGNYPFVDLSSGGTVDGLIAGLEGLLAAVGEGTKIIPGHGALASRDDLAAYLAVIRGVRDRVAALIAEGKTRDETIAAKPTAPWDAEWGQGFISGDFLAATVYDSLTGTPPSPLP